MTSDDVQVPLPDAQRFAVLMHIAALSVAVWGFAVQLGLMIFILVLVDEYRLIRYDDMLVMFAFVATLACLVAATWSSAKLGKKAYFTLQKIRSWFAFWLLLLLAIVPALITVSYLVWISWFTDEGLDRISVDFGIF